MLVGIYNQLHRTGRELAVVKAYEKILEHNGISYVKLDAEAPDFWEKVSQLDLFILRWGNYDSDRQRAYDLIPVIENNFDVKCYPDWNTCSTYDDKIKEYLLLKTRGFSFVDSNIFWDKNAALKWAESAQWPKVFKLRGGAGSTNVLLVRTKKQAIRLIRKMFGSGVYAGKVFDAGQIRLTHFKPKQELRHIAANIYRWITGQDVSPFWQVQKNYIMFQKFLPGNETDTRVTIIGDRAFAFRRKTRDGDFRASGSGKIDYDTSGIDMRCIEIAFQISKEMKFQSMAYDFLFDQDGKPQFCEISYTYVSSAIHRCTGYWDRDMNWREGHFWPELLHLQDALNMTDLKAPDLDAVYDTAISGYAI